MILFQKFSKFYYKCHFNILVKFYETKKNGLIQVLIGNSVFKLNKLFKL